MAARPLGPQSLGEALCLLRRRGGMSRNTLAATAGFSTGALSSYERDASMPSAAALRRLTRTLAERLDCEVAELWEQFGGLLECDPGPGLRRLPPEDLVGGSTS